MTKLSAQQEVALHNVKTADLAMRLAKRDANARAKVIVAQELQAHQDVRDQNVRLAFEAKVPKTRIAKEGLGSNTKYVDESLARTAKKAEIASDVHEAEQVTGRYDWNTESELLTVTLTGIELQKACEEQDWTVADATAAGVTQARFKVVHGGQALVLVGDDFLAKYAKRHPVVPWLYAHEAEALEWFAREVGA